MANSATLPNRWGLPPVKIRMGRMRSEVISAPETDCQKRCASSRSSILRVGKIHQLGEGPFAQPLFEVAQLGVAPSAEHPALVDLVHQLGGDRLNILCAARIVDIVKKEPDVVGNGVAQTVHQSLESLGFKLEAGPLGQGPHPLAADRAFEDRFHQMPPNKSVENKSVEKSLCVLRRPRIVPTRQESYAEKTSTYGVSVRAELPRAARQDKALMELARLCS